MSKNDCHNGNPLVFEANNVKVYAGGNTRNGGWMQMNPRPNLAIGPQGVIRTAKTLDCIPDGFTCITGLASKETPLLVELEWPDFSIPSNVGKEFWISLVKDIETHNIKSISCQCMGGHGRTGVQLCILAHLMLPKKQHTWKDAGELIQYIRDTYCNHAVESAAQQTYIAEVCDLPEGESKIAIASISNNIWDADTKFDFDDIEVEDDTGTKKKGKKGKKGQAKSYTKSVVVGHICYQCDDCERYEFRNNVSETGKIPCDTCGGKMNGPAGEMSLSEEQSKHCNVCYGKYHTLEMFSQQKCKACYLNDVDPESLIMSNPDKMKGREFLCARTGAKRPLVFSVIENGELIAANQAEDYKAIKRTQHPQPSKYGTPMKNGKVKKGKVNLDHFMDMEDELDLEIEIIESKDVEFLMENFDNAKKHKDKRLMDIISQRIEELYGTQ